MARVEHSGFKDCFLARDVPVYDAPCKVNMSILRGRLHSTATGYGGTNSSAIGRIDRFSCDFVYDVFDVSPVK